MTTLHRQENARFPSQAEVNRLIERPKSDRLSLAAEALAWLVIAGSGSMLLAGLAGWFFSP